MNLPDRIDWVIRILSNFQNCHILVLGDIILDKYLWGKAKRISPEAPVPVVEIYKEGSRIGGCGNVANNILSLGGKVSIGTVVGEDENGQELIAALAKGGANTAGILRDALRPTTVKTRVIAYQQQVVRFDREKSHPLTPAMEDTLIDSIKNSIGQFQAILISDYAKGIISDRLIRAVLDLAAGHNIIVTVDPKVSNFHLYKDVTIVTPNHVETEKVVGFSIQSEADLLRAADKILDQLHCKYLLITRGEEGMSLFGRNTPVFNIPTVAREVYDVTGAGDTAIASLTLALAAGASITEAAQFANFAAGVVVGKFGTATVSPTEIIKSMSQ
jgi:D-beta-D-heptose 7-phosphate kinase/D-beta-D-heptose 1-phosphate adenosyltransferase